MSSTLITDVFPRAKRQTRSSAKQEYVEASVNTLQADSNLELLRQFDLDWKYGPCTGITRLERWARAQKLNQNPPIAVRNLIQQNWNDTRYTLSVWNNYQI